jgi:hypothetical protein
MFTIPFEPEENAAISASFKKAGYRVIRIVGNKVYTDRGVLMINSEDAREINKWGTCADIAVIRFSVVES